ncbi:MAG: DUF2017 domain-containing protein [Actinomycetota bacterium]
MSEQPRVRRTRRGAFELHLPGEERALLRGLPGQLRELLDSDDPTLRRLFPPAYADDPDREAEYRRMVRDDLLAGKREALRIIEETVDARRVDEDQLTAWLGALNDLRLVLGTRLDVTEELYEEGLPEDDPRAPAFAVYAYLGWLQEQVVAALAQSLETGT